MNIINKSFRELDFNIQGTMLSTSVFSFEEIFQLNEISQLINILISQLLSPSTDEQGKEFKLYRAEIYSRPITSADRLYEEVAE